MKINPELKRMREKLLNKIADELIKQGITTIEYSEDMSGRGFGVTQNGVAKDMEELPEELSDLVDEFVGLLISTGKLVGEENKPVTITFKNITVEYTLVV